MPLFAFLTLKRYGNTFSLFKTPYRSNKRDMRDVRKKCDTSLAVPEAWLYHDTTIR